MDSDVSNFKAGDLVGVGCLVDSDQTCPAAAPVFTNSARTWCSPMRHWGVSKGKKVGIVGLGHMGVKFAYGFGAHTIVFTTTPNQKEEPLRLGADEVVVSRNADEMNAGTFDYILDCVAAGEAKRETPA